LAPERGQCYARDPMRATVAAVALVGALFAPRTAEAFERSQGFGLDAGLAVLSVSGQAAEVGISYGLHYSIALTDQFDFVAEAGGAIVDLDPIVVAMGPTNRPSMMWNADAGVIYKLDIVRFVPYFGALAGGYILSGGSLPSVQVQPGGELAVGADYLLTRSWAVGLSIREHFLFTDLGNYPSYLTVTGRFEYTWGGI
jgi:hypothetical protein